MPEWIQALILISSGIGLGLICFIAGSWIMFRGKSTPGTGEGFLRDPRGEAFTISDDRMVDEPMGFSSEPNEDEKKLLQKTERFLNVLGGGK